MKKSEKQKVYYTHLPKEARFEKRARWKAHCRRIRAVIFASASPPSPQPTPSPMTLLVGKEYHERKAAFSKYSGEKVKLRISIGHKYGLSESRVSHYGSQYKKYIESKPPEVIDK